MTISIVCEVLTFDTECPHISEFCICVKKTHEVDSCFSLFFCGVSCYTPARTKSGCAVSPSVCDALECDFLTITRFSFCVYRKICPPCESPILCLCCCICCCLCNIIFRNVAFFSPFSHQSTELFVLRCKNCVNHFACSFVNTDPVSCSISCYEIKVVDVPSVEHSCLLC